MTETIEFTTLGFLAIGWSGAREIFEECPSCGKNNKLKSKDIANENTVVCDNCGTLLQLKLIRNSV